MRNSYFKSLKKALKEAIKKIKEEKHNAKMAKNS